MVVTNGDLPPVVEAVPGAQPPNLVPPGVRALFTVPRWCSLVPALAPSEIKILIHKWGTAYKPISRFFSLHPCNHETSTT
jgi:hypothetical protein